MTGEAQGISEQDRQRWQELADNATGGRWRVMTATRYGGPDQTLVNAGPYTWSCHTVVGVAFNPADPEFIAASRTAVPALLAALADRDRELAELRDRIADYENRITWDTTCGNCARLLDSSIRDYERAERAEAELAELRAKIAAVVDRAFEAKDKCRASDDCACVYKDCYEHGKWHDCTCTLGPYVELRAILASSGSAPTGQEER